MSSPVITTVSSKFEKIVDSYSFEDDHFDYPVAPLISACYDALSPELLILRVLLYVTKNGNPVLSAHPDPARFVHGVLFINCTYDVIDQKKENLFEIWALEYKCIVENSAATNIVVTLENKDPKTSRGTMTSVQRQ